MFGATSSRLASSGKSTKMVLFYYIISLYYYIMILFVRFVWNKSAVRNVCTIEHKDMES